MAKKQDELLSSNYDGIQEYDNDLPKWWRALFYITIVFSVIYVWRYHVASTLDSEARLAEELNAIATTRAQSAPKEPDAAALLALAKDSSHVEAGHGVFLARCLACHGPLGQGLVGPNLTDEYWLHGNKITDIRRTVANGVLEKGMLAWKGVIPDSEINDVVAYLHSIQGSNPPNPKAPQGDKFEGNE